MVRRVLGVLCLGITVLFMSSCGQTYKVQSIAVTPAAGYILLNSAPTGQLTVTATFSNTKTEDVTLSSTYPVGGSGNPTAGAAPLNAVTVSESGLVEASGTIPACTYVPATSGTGFTSYPYTVTVTYTNNGVTVHQPVSINVATAPGCGETTS
jgi:hypothetical protein